MWEYLLLTALGLVAGIINVIAGGGSLLTLPAMILMGIPETVANGTNRVAIFAQNITAVTAFRKKGFSDFKTSLTLGLCALPGGIAGAWCGAYIRGDLFNLILGLIMIGVVVLMVFKNRKAKAAPTSKVKAEKPARQKADEPASRSRFFLGHLAMVLVGFYGGFIQAGVGFLIMAVLNQVMQIDLIRVNMHKVFIVGFFTAAALVVFILTKNVWWIPGIALAVGNSVGGWIGSHLTISKGEVFVRRFLYVAVLVMAVKLLLGK